MQFYDRTHGSYCFCSVIVWSGGYINIFFFQSVLVPSVIFLFHHRFNLNSDQIKMFFSSVIVQKKRLLFDVLSKKKTKKLTDGIIHKLLIY